MSFFYPRSVRGKLLVNEPARRILWYVDEFQIGAHGTMGSNGRSGSIVAR